MKTDIHEKVEACLSGEYPNLVCKAPSGFVIAGPQQVVKGYCLLLPNPVVADLNALQGEDRESFLRDLGHLGDALLEVTGAARINYEILGNKAPALHAHAFPRYADEPEELREEPIWFYDWMAARNFDPAEDGNWMRLVAERFTRLTIR